MKPEKTILTLPCSYKNDRKNIRKILSNNLKSPPPPKKNQTISFKLYM